MSQRQAKYITSEAFPEPNFTQVPNRFFEMLSENMEASEARVTMIMIRETYGYHKADFKMGIGKLAAAAGVSRGSAKDGAEAAEKRGTFRRVNPTKQGEAEWELVVDNQSTPSNGCIPPMQPLYSPPPTIDPQVRVKERNKENKPDLLDGMLYYAEQAKQNGEGDIEEVAVKLERGLRFNFPRGMKDQQVYKRILKSGVSIDRFIEWVKADEKRLSYAFLYAKDTETIWRDLPQVESNPSYNPQGLTIE